jgi:hypothetical protein
VIHIGSGSVAAAHMASSVIVLPWESSAEPLPIAPGWNDVIQLDCLTGAADDEVSSDTSSRYRDLLHRAWRRPHSHLSIV